jgi:PilZ domain
MTTQIKPTSEDRYESAREDDWRIIRAERRWARRFYIRWNVLILSLDDTDSIFCEPGELVNLGSSGALIYLSRFLKPGTKLIVRLRVPFRKENWMLYSGEVVRIQNANLVFGIAVKFDTSRPKFIEQ